MDRLLVAFAVVVVMVGLFFVLRPRRAPRHRVAGQLPMLSFMILYTVFGLWILAQPIVG